MRSAARRIPASRSRPRLPCGPQSRGEFAAAAMIVPVFVAKMRRALTFLATIENDHPPMRTSAVISILALLTITGAAYTDQLLIGEQQTAQGAN
jgi:hypothetical protein